MILSVDFVEGNFKRLIPTMSIAIYQYMMIGNSQEYK